VSVLQQILLVLADPEGADAVHAALGDAHRGGFTVERISRCSDAVERLATHDGNSIAAVIVDLFLPDSQGLGTFDALSCASPCTPLLVVSHRRDEPVARRAVQLGAQDYLLFEHLDRYGLRKALDGMFARAARAEGLHRAAVCTQATLDSIGDAVVSTDLAGNVAYLNPVAEHMTGWSASEASGRPLREVVRIIYARSREQVPDPLAMAMRQDHTVGLGEDCLLVRRDGQESAIEDTAAPIHDSRGKVTGAVIVFHDVGAARAMSVRMSHLAQHDPLTGLPNRLLLTDRLDRAIVEARRRDGALALLFIDLDDFKRINDTLGHATGDEVLKSVARRLKACVRDSDTVSRQGGDEFVALLSEVAGSEDAEFSADNLLAGIAAPHRVNDQDLHVTASVGIAVYPADGTDAESLLKKADLAQLRAKAHRRVWPTLAFAAVAAAEVTSNASRVKSAPDGNQFPELGPART
jgi:diguanylate cyclase (GGDEF)-like protein/PAS domain S-box-containing protein